MLVVKSSNEYRNRLVMIDKMFIFIYLVGFIGNKNN